MKEGHRLTLPAVAFVSFIAACDGASGGLAPSSRLGDVTAAAADQPFADWSAPVNLGPTVNSPFVDNLPEVSTDGLSLYFTSGRPGGSGALDLWVSRRANLNDPWGTPVNLGSVVNSSANDAAPNLSRDGHYLFITSNRAGGEGDNDIWVFWRADIHDDFAWGDAVNLGSPINGATFDAGAAFRPSEFYFTSGAVSTALDIYVAPFLGRAFGQPVVVTELSSAFNDQRPSIRYDRREIYFSSNRPNGFGLDDLWYAERGGPGLPWFPPVNVGAIINTTFVDTQPALSEDGTELFFSSNRTGGSGGLDLWMTTRGRGSQD